MSDFIWQELRLLGIAFGTGVGFRACYDLILIHRGVCRLGNVITGIQDVLYWLAGCICIFSMIYHTNDGIIRWFVLAGIFLGMLCYHKLISGVIVGCCCRVIGAVQRIFVRLRRKIAAICRKVFFRKKTSVEKNPTRKKHLFERKVCPEMGKGKQ